MSVGAGMDVEGDAVSRFSGGLSECGKEMTSVTPCLRWELIPRVCDIEPNCTL